MEKCYLSRFVNSDKLDQYSKETTPLNQILGGYLRSTVRCLACQHLSTTYQHFQVNIFLNTYRQCGSTVSYCKHYDWGSIPSQGLNYFNFVYLVIRHSEDMAWC